MSRLVKIVKTFIGECWHANYNEACIAESLLKNCLHQKTIGKCIGIESFTSDCKDWSVAFPNYTTEIKTIKEYRNVVVCNVGRKGTHTNRYSSTNRDRKSILIKSDFFTTIENSAPTGRSYEQPAQLIFAFEKEKISQIIIEENPTGLPEQLGLKVCRQELCFLLDTSLQMRSLNESLQASLSERELECLALGFCGFSAKHIAEILKVSFRTVETHLCHAYQKLGCYGKQQVLESMYEKELLTLWLDLGKLLLMRYNTKRDK
jgi:DNA-binding CsgD family transcriptional regulator